MGVVLEVPQVGMMQLRFRPSVSNEPLGMVEGPSSQTVWACKCVDGVTTEPLAPGKKPSSWVCGCGA